MENISGFLHRDPEDSPSGTPLISSEDHERVLMTCVDVPEQEPRFPISLDEVGISNKTVWVRLPEGRIPLEAVITVNLPETARGIHMSRMEEVISELSGRAFEDMGEYAESLARGIAYRQAGNLSVVRLWGKLPWVHTTVASEKRSADSISVSAESTFTKSRTECPCRTTLAVSMDHITACPCTQIYNQELFHSGADRIQPTHSQRSTTELAITCPGKPPSVSEMVTCLQTALHTTSDLLKRTDEAEIVLRSHKAPQFAEDAVRETAWAVGRLLGDHLPPETRVRISSVSLESIHTHNVTCRLTTNIEEIRAVMESQSDSRAMETGGIVRGNRERRKS